VTLTSLEQRQHRLTAIGRDLERTAFEPCRPEVVLVYGSNPRCSPYHLAASARFGTRMCTWSSRPIRNLERSVSMSLTIDAVQAFAARVVETQLRAVPPTPEGLPTGTPSPQRCNDQSSTTVRSVNSGTSKISVVVALAASSPPGCESRLRSRPEPWWPHANPPTLRTLLAAGPPPLRTGSP